jgi:hypothetical protein
LRECPDEVPREDEVLRLAPPESVYRYGEPYDEHHGELVTASKEVLDV